MNKHSVRKFLAALSLVLGTGFVLTVGAQAQSTAPTTPATPPAPAAASSDQSSDQTVQLQKFVVTGSNIPTAAEALAVPVISVTFDQIQNSGTETNTLDILRKMVPSISGIGEENANIQTASTYGGAQLLIHGLPALILVNGQRVATSSAEAVGANSFVDLNLIPPSAIQSIDVLQDGSSAIYGSDALGGVININLKKDFNGWDVRSHWGESPNPGHYTERTFSIVGGVSDGKNSVTLSAEYTQNPYILFSQRPDTAQYGASVNIPGVVDIYNAVAGGVGTSSTLPLGGTGGDEFYILAPGVNAPPGGGTYTMAQLVAMGVYLDLGNAFDPVTGPATLQKVYSHLNLAAHQTLDESLKRESGSVNWEHKFNDALSASGTVLYAQTVTESTLNAQPLGPQIDNSTDPWLDENLDFGTPTPTLAAGDQFMNYTAPTNPFSLNFLQEGETYSLDQYGDPYPSGNDVTAHNRLEAYPRIFQNTSTQLNAVGKLDGKVGTDYTWTASVDYSREGLQYQNKNVINAANFQTELNNGQLNPFALTQAPGELPGDLLGTAYVSAVSDLTTGEVLVTGSPWDLPAGKLSFALGMSISREVINANADQNSETDLWVDAPTILPIDRQRKWFSYFGELEIPLIGQQQKIPGAYLLNLDIAGRNDDYYGVGDSKTPKVSAKWEPFSDDFAIRATAGKSFLAPPMYLLYGPTNQGASQSINYTPLGQSVEFQNVQFQAAGGSNPDLQPAKGTDWTVGFVLNPKQVKGLSVSFDYFDSVTKDFFGIIPEQTIIQSVENLGPASPYNDLIHFGNINGPIPTAAGQISTHPSHSVWIFDSDINVGATAIKGWDATLEYNRRTESFGTFDLQSQVTFYNSYLFQAIPSENYYQYSGTASQNVGTASRYRIYSTLDWKFHEWEVVTGNTYIPAVVDIGTGGSTASAPVPVSKYVQEDFAVTYHFHSNTKAGTIDLGYLNGLSFTLGVDNAFNENIPVSRGAFPDTYGDVGNYNGGVGRMYYFDCDYKF